MPPVFAIDDDGPARAAHAALRRRDNPLAVPGSRLRANGATAYDAMVADVCMLDAKSTAKIRELMQRQPATLLVAITRGGTIAPISDAPDFLAMADRLVAK
jgi:hypothetical protein